MLNPSHIRTFQGVAAAGSFSKAARALGMTQPGVSQHIARLEASLGARLVCRCPRGVELTPAGQRLLRYAREREAAEQTLRQQIGRDDPFAGECRVSSPGSFGLYAYPRLLDLQRQHPKLIISYAFSPNRTIQREIKAGEIHLGLMTGPIEDRALAAEPIGEEVLQIVVPKGYVVDGFAALERLGFIAHPDGGDHATRALRAHFGRAFRGVDMLRRGGFSNQISLLLDPVARGFGFTVLPEHAVTTSRFRGAVDVLETPSPVRDPVSAVWRGDTELPARFRTLLDVLRGSEGAFKSR